jgi:hypothetical protein
MMLLYFLFWFSHPAQAQISSKCLVPFRAVIAEAKEGKASKATVAAECQYYQLKELDSETQNQVLQLLKKNGRPAPGLDTKLSAVFGSLLSKEQGSSVPVVPGNCEDFAGHFRQQMGNALSKTMNKKDCFDALQNFTQDHPVPPDCAAQVQNDLEMGKGKCNTKRPSS